MSLMYIKALLSELKNKIFWIIGAAILCALVFGFIGYINTSDELSEEDLTAIAEYEENLDNYEQIIAEAIDNIALSEEQVENYQDYIDNSIYMKLDSQAIEIATAQYAINDAGNTNNVLSGFTTYINDGSLKEDICNAMPEIQVEYLKELLSCSTSNNTLTVTVMHYNADTADAIMDQIDKLLFSYKSTVADVQGDFNLERLNRTQYSKSDINVLNNQNTYLNNLKNYQNSLADYQKKLVDGRTNRDNYIKNYTPDAYGKTPDSPVKNAVIYLVFGAIVGIVGSCGVIAILSTRIRDEKELLNAGITTLGTFDGKDKYSPEIDRSIIDIQMIVEHNGSDSVFLDALGTGEDYKKVISDYSAKLTDAGITVSSGNSGLTSADETRAAIDAHNGILIIKLADTKFEQVDEHQKLYEKLGISMCGSIVID